VSRLHLLGGGRLLASTGLLAGGGLLGSGALLLGNREKREAGQNRKTDRPGNQVFSSQLTAPTHPHQKSNRCPQLLFHPRSKELVNGGGESGGKYGKHCCAAATEHGRPRRAGPLLPTFSQRPEVSPSFIVQELAPKMTCSDR
jgi:hypothetical protein